MEEKITKASFKNCPLSEREGFHLSHVLIPISVGQRYHEGHKFEATLRLVNQKFNKATILVGDTLQRHNIEVLEELGGAEAFQLARQRGDDWLERVRPLLSLLKIPFNFIRWDYWLEHPEFELAKQKVSTLYAEDGSYQSSFSITVNDFLLRNRDFFSSSRDREHASRLCLRYLIEECAAMLIWPETKCQFELYPSKRTPAMQSTYERLIMPSYPDCIKPVSLRFKKYKAPETSQLEAV